MSDAEVPQSAEVERERYLREVRAAMAELASERRAAHEVVDLRDIIAELDSDD